MMFILIYQQNNEQHELEWYAPSNWTIEQVKQSFIKRHPNATLIDIHCSTNDCAFCIA
jgi:hypothetical protein